MKFSRGKKCRSYIIVCINFVFLLECIYLFYLTTYNESTKFLNQPYSILLNLSMFFILFSIFIKTYKNVDGMKVFKLFVKSIIAMSVIGLFILYIARKFVFTINEAYYDLVMWLRIYIVIASASIVALKLLNEYE